MDRETILKAEHDSISDAYDWMNDHDAKHSAEARIQYILGIHDMALALLNRLDETKGEK